MGLNETASAERIHIGFFGKRNAGKSSLVNAVTNQDMSIVSEIRGTTTDTVRKAMELLPLGPVVIIDTPGMDDEGLLGEKRVAAAKRVLASCDIAVLCVDGSDGVPDLYRYDEEKAMAELFKKRGIPYVIAITKSDLKEHSPSDVSLKTESPVIRCSAVTGEGIEELKAALAASLADRPEKTILADLVNPGDTVVLVVPIDASAPKGRLILPQQLVLREILDIGAMAFVTREKELAQTLAQLKESPKLVVTDSQAFAYVKDVVPESMPLTSFSILMARYKGFLGPAYEGAKLIRELPEGARILIAEGCTHHRQCEDIGTVKLPKWLKKYTGRDFRYEWSSGRGYPEDLADFDLVLHCGGCMLNEKEMQYRMREALAAGVPFTNYGIAIAEMNGILGRATAMLPELTR